MKRIVLFLCCLLTASYAFTQDCEAFYPIEKGTFIENKGYDDKGEFAGTTKQTITDVTHTAKGLEIKVQSEQLDKKEKSLGTQDLTMRCEDGVFYMDMKNFFNQSAATGQSNTEASIDATDLLFPANLKVGETLPDGKMTIGMGMISMGVSIYNRKVLAIENVTTPAGTFECYKLSYDIDLKIPVKISNSAIQWVAKNVGAVRTETYNKKGKMLGYSELSAFHK
ncbi:MAG: hypothetical protein ACM3PX_03795 [Omnitrophica WOR_2 bacterium]